MISPGYFIPGSRQQHIYHSTLWRGQDLNLRPPDHESGTLTNCATPLFKTADISLKTFARRLLR